MNYFRRTMIAAGALAFLGAWVPAQAQRAAPLVSVYKSPTCGCCGEWVKHMRANGFRVERKDVPDVGPIRRANGVPDSLASCHTALVGGYAIEGHVPAADIQRLLRERPAVRGLAVPGMPASAPGMEQRPPRPYTTLAFCEGGRAEIFERH